MGRGKGGGIYCIYSTSFIMNNEITDNEAFSGGGIGCHYSSLLISGNNINGNLGWHGGGISDGMDVRPLPRLRVHQRPLPDVIGG